MWDTGGTLGFQLGFQKCYTGGTLGFQKCYTGGTLGFQKCYTGGTLGFQKCYTGGTLGFHVSLSCFGNLLYYSTKIFQKVI
jgi:hypothetical protein